MPGQALSQGRDRVADVSGTAQSDVDGLVARAIGGDAAAFTALYDRFYDRIYRHVYYRTGRVEDAEDLTQQVFLQAWRALGRFRPGGSPFVAWLFTIAHNVVVNFYRRRRFVEPLPDGATDSRADAGPDHDLRLEQERVREAIKRLRVDQQQVVVMRFLEDLSHREIAAALGKTETNVRVIQHRALHELRRVLEREES
ncbi:MAG: sigma-70 family RNA polymerase sigma factor [Chloroflexi bacterium]|nr:sigma-70 family RNA polymerase sigma factor [Chloroflexota bacterium]